jgi:hypothetical protein
VWTRQFGTESWDFALSVASTTPDGLLVGGDSYGELAPGRIKGRDPFLLFLDAVDGSDLGGVQFGTLGHDFCHDMAADSDGSAVVVGTTGARLGAEPEFGGFDAFVVKIPPP